MYIIDEESLSKILGGEFYQVILARKINPKISINKLFKHQYKYTTYPGFRKFFRRHLENAIEGIRIVEEDSLLAKFIKWVTHEKV